MTREDLIQAMSKAMCSSKAWPAVYDAGTAQILSRAAISVIYEAMKEPSEEMLEAYFDDCARHGFHAHINATTALRALLSDSPLSDKGEKG